MSDREQEPEILTESLPQTADELIAKLQSLRASHGGDALVSLHTDFDSLYDDIMELPEEFRLALIFFVLVSMRKKERRRFIRHLEDLHPWMLGYVMVKWGLLETVLNSLPAAAKLMAKDGEKIRELRAKLEKRGNHAAAKKALTRDRIKAMDKLFEDGHKGAEIYELMRLYHGGLIPSRAKKDGSKDPYMTESKMWESYLKKGGKYNKDGSERSQL